VPLRTLPGAGGIRADPPARVPMGLLRRRGADGARATTLTTQANLTATRSDRRSGGHQVASLMAVLVLLAPALGYTAPLDSLDPGRDWKLLALHFHGNAAVGTRALRAALVTKARPWFTPWRPLPPFDPIAFRADLE